MTSCDQDFVELIEAAIRQDRWALKVFDSWGKPLPSGLLVGNFFWIGNYDECIQPIYSPESKTFVKQPFDTLHCTLFPESEISQMNLTENIVLGLCVPASCDRKAVASLIRELFKKSNVSDEQIVCSNEQKNLSTGPVATCFVLALLGILVLIGTIVHLVLAANRNSIARLTSHINIPFFFDETCRDEV
ncbi:unnamed protein product [Rotaria sordida]|uniref:Nose resistant-to-fluoxetine protein N-terminal domain-containing protein n=1 Tax=Rotaria sordida TaxID=392033 RepID=A0A815AAC1_9BILA|nr:unnamed protein product [Rotaria sordida]CAF1253944.1 unnamed protein product [Rotaria sordida]